MQKNDSLKSMHHDNFEPTCTCQNVVPPELLLSLQSCACWGERVVGGPRLHKCTPATSRQRPVTVPAASLQSQDSSGYRRRVNGGARRIFYSFISPCPSLLPPVPLSPSQLRSKSLKCTKMRLPSCHPVPLSSLLSPSLRPKCALNQ